jgi:hypothetical protein
MGKRLNASNLLKILVRGSPTQVPTLVWYHILLLYKSFFELGGRMGTRITMQPLRVGIVWNMC